MKKLILSTMVLAIAASTVNGQETAKSKNDGGVYLRVGVGYSFPLAGAYISGTETSTPTNYTTDLKKGSYSAGFNAALAGGFMFNRNIGVELAVGAGIAPKKYTSEFDETNTGDYKSTSIRYAKMPIMIMPSIVLSSGNTGLELYSRMGLAINVAGKLVEEYEMVNRGGAADVITNVTEEYKPSIGLGVQGALGAKYHVNDMLGIYLEINGLAMTGSMKSSEVTLYEVNGTSEIGNLSVYDLQTEYSANYTETYSSTSTSTPYKANPMAVPFSNLGVGVGVTLKF